MIWDLAGEDSSNQVQLSYLKGASGYLLVCDGTWAESVAIAKSIHGRILDQMEQLPFLLVVNKSDLRDKWELTSSELEKLEADGWKVRVTSAKSGDGVDDMFKAIAEETLKAPNPLKVFLCHASEDSATLQELHHRLSADGFEPWLDQEDLLGGQNWAREIPRAIRGSDVVLVCLSQQSTTKEGYLQKEVREARDVANEKPPGKVFLIPVLLDDCSVPEYLNEFHVVKLWQTDGYERLRRALKSALQNRRV